MAVSLVRSKFCPSGGGSAFLENGYGIERDPALAFRASQAIQRPAHSAAPLIIELILPGLAFYPRRAQRSRQQIPREQPRIAIDGARGNYRLTPATR
jgi:hypothetical protein